jgi:hypothetical protein
VPYRTREQYERWHIRDCARCGRRGGLAANWEGPVCRTCHDKAARTYGRCAGCGAGRLLPGRRGDGAATCRDCAGITRDFTCARCGREALLLGGRLCERCTLEEQLAAILDDGTGQVSPPMRSLLDTVLSTVRPKSGLQWLRDPRVPGLLAGLATGAIPLTHEALHGLPDWRMVSHLRSLLMACGALPARDKHLLYAEAWLHRELAALAGDPHERVFPVIQDEDVAVTEDEDVRATPRPRRLVLAGPWCACWRGGGQSVVISVTAARALVSSTMDLRPAQAATRAWVAMLLTARGSPRAASWMRAAASSLNSGSDRPASLR